MRPFQRKEETVYVVPGSDAEAHASRRFPHKTAKKVSGSLRPNSIERFLDGLRLVFQRNQADGLDATYHFTFMGDEEREATIVIRNKELQVEEGHVGNADLHVTANARTWLGFLRKERNLIWALLTRRIRMKGSPRLLLAFGKCFPS